MKEYNIVVASDRTYIGLVSVLFASILSNKGQDEKIVFHLLANDIPSSSLDPLLNQMKNEVLHVYPIENLKALLKVTVPPTIAITAYARLFLTELLPGSIDKILYLDCDIIVNQSLNELFSNNIDNYYVAGVLDTLPNNDSKIKVGMASDNPYINSGVLFINLKKWRDERIINKFLDFLLLYNGRVHHHDQGIINAVLDKKLIIGPEFNLTSNYFTHKYSYLKKRNYPFYLQNEIEFAKHNPVIIHFTEGFLDRPWFIGSKHPYANKFLEYKKQSIIAGQPLQKSKKTWYVKLLGFEFINMPLPFYQITSLLFSLLSKIKRK